MVDALFEPHHDHTNHPTAPSGPNK